MGEMLEDSRPTADAIVVGGGTVGMHAAHALYEAMGPEARILNITADDQFGGQTDKSLEQVRQFNESQCFAEMVEYGLNLYDRAAQETGQPTYQRYPYIFTVGNKNPGQLIDIAPEDMPERPDLAFYKDIINKTKSWGFDPEAEVVSPDELRGRYPLLDGDGIESAVIVNQAGRLHWNAMKNWLMDRTRADGDGRGVSYRTNAPMQQVVLSKGGRAIGIELANGEKIYSDNIILALGAFAVNLPELLPGDESQRLAANSTPTQRELLYAPAPGLPDKTDFFVASPDMAIARLSASEGRATYGFAAPDDMQYRYSRGTGNISRNHEEFQKLPDRPVGDPKPNREDSHHELFAARVYALLNECSSRYDPDRPPEVKATAPDLAVSPTGHTAGYYTEYKDGVPVVGKLGDSEAVVALDASHNGVMTGAALGKMAADYALGLRSFSQTTLEQTGVTRTPAAHASLVL
jgi:glycine/D-amino acid oxidase-like deaminating enzyme